LGKNEVEKGKSLITVTTKGIDWELGAEGEKAVL